MTPIENSVLCASKEADALLGMGILKVAVCLKRTQKMNEMCEAQISDFAKLYAKVQQVAHFMALTAVGQSLLVLAFILESV